MLTKAPLKRLSRRPAHCRERFPELTDVRRAQAPLTDESGPAAQVEQHCLHGDERAAEVLDELALLFELLVERRQTIRRLVVASSQAVAGEGCHRDVDGRNGEDFLGSYRYRIGLAVFRRTGPTTYQKTVLFQSTYNRVDVANAKLVDLDDDGDLDVIGRERTGYTAQRTLLFENPGPTLAVAKITLETGPMILPEKDGVLIAKAFREAVARD